MTHLGYCAQGPADAHDRHRPRSRKTEKLYARSVRSSRHCVVHSAYGSVLKVFVGRLALSRGDAQGRTARLCCGWKRRPMAPSWPLPKPGCMCAASSQLGQRTAAAASQVQPYRVRLVLRNTSPAYLDAFVERECGSSSTKSWQQPALC